jgi:hypothetical protein
LQIGSWFDVAPTKLVMHLEQLPWAIGHLLTSKVGKPIQVFTHSYDPNDPESPQDNILLFKETPSLQAAHCEPAMEVIQAMVTVDKDTATILSYEPSGAPEGADAAWHEAFRLHDLSAPGTPYTKNYTGSLNVTTR